MVNGLLMFGLLAMFLGWAIAIVALLAVGVFTFLFKRNVKFQLADGIEAYALMAFRIGIGLVFAAMAAFVISAIALIIKVAASVVLS